MSEPAFSLRLTKSAARWADKNLPETGETVWEALGALPNDRPPCPEALMFLRDWLVTNPLRVFQMTGPGLVDEMAAVETAAKILEHKPRPCSLMEAIQAWGSRVAGVVTTEMLTPLTEEEDKVRRKVYSHLRKSRII